MTTATPTALVTGAAGFLGRHIADKLRAEGYHVTAVDRTSTDPRIFCVSLRNWLQNNYQRYDVVVHCAAVVGGRKQIEGDPLELSVNLDLDATLFRWARHARPGRVVYISSSAVYPISRQTKYYHTLLSEDLVMTGDNVDYVNIPDKLYGWTKLMGERLALEACRCGVPVTVVRPFSGYGSDQSADYPFGAFLERALNREDPFTIWGSGRQIRDWIHVDDICDAIMTLVHREVDGPINLGTGRGVSMTDLALMVCKMSGYTPDFKFLSDRPSGVYYRVANTRLLNDYFTHSIELGEGIDRALRDRGEPSHGDSISGD